MTFLDQLRRNADPSGFTELERVAGIPHAQILEDGDLDEVSRSWVKAEHYAEGFRLTRARSSGSSQRTWATRSGDPISPSTDAIWRWTTCG